MDFDIDAVGLDAVVSDFTRRSLTIGPKVMAVTAVAARKIKEDARGFVEGSTRLPHLARSITYDVGVEGSAITAEIGPELGGQGSLGHIIEYGTATTPPNTFMAPAFDRELPNWIQHIERVAE